jgi:glycosyltransferase involved in cell wall biosynthesis
MGRSTQWRRAIDYCSFFICVFIFLLTKVRRGDLVVLKTDPPLLSLVNTAAIRVKGGRVVNWLQDIFPEIAIELGAYPRNGVLSRPLIWWRNRTLRAAEANVVISRKMEQFLTDQGVTNTYFVPNWADGELIQSLAHADNPLRGEWGVEDKFVVGYSGNFGRAHTFDEIIEAMTLLKDRPEIHFVLIGEGAGLDDLLGAVERKRLNNVSFYPYQSQDTLHQSLGAIDLHLVTLSGSMEGLVFPSKFYGVLAAGRPLAYVGATDGEIGELIKREDIGFVVDHGDGTELAERIQLLAREPDRLITLGGNARRLFDRDFARSKSLRRWNELLGEVLPPGSN